MQDKLEEIRVKHNLSESEHQQISSMLAQMGSATHKNIREEHQRLRRVLKFLTSSNEALQQDVLHLLWETSAGNKERHAEERRQAKMTREPRTGTQDAIEI